MSFFASLRAPRLSLGRSDTSVKSSNDEDPEHLTRFCLLTGEPASDPVQDPLGNVFERKEIMRTLKETGKNPVTGKRMDVKDLVPVHTTVQVQTTELPHPRNAHTRQVMVEITPPVQKRTAAHICCVIDVSGSMGLEASVQSQDGSKESSGLNILDVVKHSVRTIISILEPQDKLSIVSYSSQARIESRPVRCDSQGKQRLLDCLETLSPDGCTNLWDGLKCALDLVVEEESAATHMQSIFLLTDGMPNVEPHRGHMPTFHAYLDKYAQGKTPCAINTFGFGYSLDTDLLCSIAMEGSGAFSFIPDAALVGTVFIHSIARTLCTYAQDVELKLELLNGAQLCPSDNGTDLEKLFSTLRTSWGAILRTGNICLGKRRTFLLNLDLEAASASEGPFVDISVEYKTVQGRRISKQVYRDAASVSQDEMEQVCIPRSALAKARFATLQCIQDLTLAGQNATAERVQSAIEELDSLKRITPKPSPQEEGIDAISQDLSGQVSIAVSVPAYMNRWGKHYLPSLFFAHLLEFCNNFKDPGVQQYGKTSLFSELRAKGEAEFVKLPPPKPANPAEEFSFGSSFGARFRGSASSLPVARVVDMGALYLNSSAPCFAGHCRVSMADGSFKTVDQLSRGDRLRSPKAPGGTATILCVVKTLIGTEPIQMVHFDDGLVITPYHPVLCANGTWAFPMDLKAPQSTRCEAIFSFILDSGHTMEIDGVECVTLAHDFTEDCVAHPYFGSQQVLDDLKLLVGWADGLVQLYNGCLIRDPVTRLVVGIDPAFVYTTPPPLPQSLVPPQDLAQPL